MDDLEGYREARAAAWGNSARHDAFELEGFLNGVMDVGSDARKRQITLRIGCGCSLVMLVLMSVGSLMPLQYGMTINAITRQVNSDVVLHGGRHLIGPWNSFIYFPSTVVTVTFMQGSGNGPLKTRTKDGLELTLQLAFQYQIDPKTLGKLYQLANLQYEPLFVRNARDVLLKAAADYEASEYWQDREKIGGEMMALLDDRLSTVYATCAGLQLLVIELPAEFEDSIVRTQVQQQMVKTRQNEQVAYSIRADTKVLEAAYSRNVTVTRSGADALYDQRTRIAEAVANQRMLEIEAATMRRIRERLSLSAEQIVAYQQFAAYRNLKNASFIYGMRNAMLSMPATS